jgi:2-C-methyl-D-erythritol 4-phosphate cytidylyltransferase
VKAQLLIPAAGMGTRLGTGGPKALLDLCGEPMIVHTLRRFEPLDLVHTAVIVVHPGHEAAIAEACSQAFPGARFRIVHGGAERQESVLRGLDALDPGTTIVAVHDAARPFVSPASVKQSIEAAEHCGAATVAIPSTDTILIGDEHGFLVDTPDRSRLWACQTPQTFKVEVLRKAHQAALSNGHAVTDDATLVQRAGGRVQLVRGSTLNFKVTMPEDADLARIVIEKGLAPCA